MRITTCGKTFILFEHKLLKEVYFITEAHSSSAFKKKKARNKMPTLFANKSKIMPSIQLKLSSHQILTCY